VPPQQMENFRSLETMQCQEQVFRRHNTFSEGRTVLNICMWIKIPSDTNRCVILSIKYIGYIASASTRSSSGHYKNLLKLKITRFGGVFHTGFRMVYSIKMFLLKLNKM
jgi:hypothetical protein